MEDVLGVGEDEHLIGMWLDLARDAAGRQGGQGAGTAPDDGLGYRAVGGPRGSGHTDTAWRLQWAVHGLPPMNKAVPGHPIETDRPAHPFDVAGHGGKGLPDVGFHVWQLVEGLDGSGVV